MKTEPVRLVVRNIPTDTKDEISRLSRFMKLSHKNLNPNIPRLMPTFGEGYAIQEFHQNGNVVNAKIEVLEAAYKNMVDTDDFDPLIEAVIGTSWCANAIMETTVAKRGLAGPPEFRSRVLDVSIDVDFSD